MGVISLIRHGAVDGPSALYGHTNIAATDEGNSRVIALLESLHQVSPITHLVCSPLIRCKIPAERFAASAHINLAIEPDFRELNFGEWDGLAFDHYDEYFAAAPENGWPRLTHFYESPYQNPAPAGEPIEAFSTRITKAFTALLNETFNANDTSHHTAIVCHGGVIRMILAQVLGIADAASLFSQVRIDYASLTSLTAPGKELRQCHITQVNHSLPR